MINWIKNIFKNRKNQIIADHAASKKTELNYSSKNLKSFPTEILKHVNVVKVDLSTNEGPWDVWIRPNTFKKIPDEISTLKNLEYLDLSRTEVESIPPTFGQLENLKYLDISSTKITKLPECIFQLGNLEILNLDNCQIDELPEAIAKLGKLKILSADNCSISTIPNTFGQLKNLEELHLYNNFITHLPLTIGSLENLKVLKMGSYEKQRNQIREMPKEIGNLKKLRHIHLGNNCLKTLPIELIDCSSLEELALWDNEFEEIPEFLAKMTLKDLNFYSNPIKTLPRNYIFLTKIGKLTLDEHLDLELEKKMAKSFSS